MINPENIAEAVRKHVEIEEGRAAGDNETFRRWLGKHELGEMAMEILMGFCNLEKKTPESETPRGDGSWHYRFHSYYGLVIGIYEKSGGLLFCMNEQIPDIFEYTEDLRLTKTA